MKTVKNIRLGLRPQEVAEALGSEKLYRKLKRAGWLKPVVARHRLVIFEYADVCRAWERVKSEGVPDEA